MDTPLWVFGYGSLIWNPEFPVAEQQIARLDGWHRSFCMRSIHHRGTEADPGLVLALDAAARGHCNGVAFRVQPGAEARTMADLRERELVSSAYLEITCDLTLHDGRSVRAVTYVVDRDHVQYCGDLPLDEQARIIAQAVGGRGPNTEYLWNTEAHLREIGLHDPDLAWLAERVRELTDPV
jgi:cation transport protein ChaC